MQEIAVEESKAPGISEIVITNAENLSNTTYACATSPKDLKLTTLTPVYDSAKKTLTLMTADKSPMSPASVKDIHFGSVSDVNLCGGQFYKL